MAEPKTAEELVQGACAACHISGVGGAPKLDDTEGWAARREAGLDALIASVTNGKGAMPARGGSAYSDEEIRLAVQQIAGFEASDADAAGSSTETSDADSAGDSAATTAAGAEATVAAAGELTDRIKGTVDSLCISCHISGVAGAPKLGDTADWEKRAAAGMDALVESVVNGKGAMPPRAGSDLTDAELPAAITYLMSKE